MWVLASRTVFSSWWWTWLAGSIARWGPHGVKARLPRSPVQGQVSISFLSSTWFLRTHNSGHTLLHKLVMIRKCLWRHCRITEHHQGLSLSLTECTFSTPGKPSRKPKPRTKWISVQAYCSDIWGCSHDPWTGGTSREPPCRRGRRWEKAAVELNTTFRNKTHTFWHTSEDQGKEH